MIITRDKHTTLYFGDRLRATVTNIKPLGNNEFTVTLEVLSLNADIRRCYTATVPLLNSLNDKLEKTKVNYIQFLYSEGCKPYRSAVIGLTMAVHAIKYPEKTINTVVISCAAPRYVPILRKELVTFDSHGKPIMENGRYGLEFIKKNRYKNNA